ncbi:EAL domain-containing protein [Marispirochaeta sp.]|uniref:sensor domain-containing protein n=1 Tax=Marispirochaeta sp. TaxID=2038653 RepID=UPI0029C97731|nr:EAL domain-containing protein [Marispirochaeta sp.]
MSDDLIHHIIHATDDFIAVLDMDFNLVLVNDAYLKTFNQSKEEILERNFFDLWPGIGKTVSPEERKLRILECIRNESTVFIEPESAEGNYFRFKKAFYPFGRDKEASHIIAVFHDVSDIEAIESRLTHYEFRDHITGLFNRRSLEIILDMELEKARRSRGDYFKALLFIGIANLGTVNDSIGFETGDLLLESIGCRIKETLRKSDYVFRFEGNELAVLLTTLQRTTDVAQVADKLGEIISLPYHTGKASFNLSSVIGISTYPEDGESSKELIQRSSAAMREAKRKGTGFLHWDPVLHANATERLKMKSELTRAFRADEFGLLYQPIVDAAGEIRGVETFLRWRHPDRGILKPETFLSILEENRNISTLTRWVLLQTAEQIAPLGGRHGIFFNVNLSFLDLMDPDIEVLIQKILRENTDAVKLNLEIGNAGETQWKKVKKTMDRVSALGINFVLSDFAGSSDFISFLRDYPVNGVKINIAACAAARNPEDLVLIQDMAILARHQNKKVFIEGIENKDMAEAARNVEGDYLQGYYFAEPVPSAVLEELLTTGHHLPR